MFNLQNAMAGWRRQMSKAGIKAPVLLDELESHLREEMEHQISSGLNAEAAFHEAVRQMGEARILKGEFKKIQATNPRNQMLKTFIILAALFGSVFGGALVLPALGHWNRTGVLNAWPLILGGAVTLIAGAAALYGVSRYRGLRGRKLISLGIIASGSFYLVPLIQAFFMAKVEIVGWIFCALLAAASILFYGKCFQLNRQTITGNI